MRKLTSLILVVFTIALTLTMIMTLCVPAFAMDIKSDTGKEMSVEQARSIAYMDISNVDKEAEDEILEARKIIIMNESWVADGLDGWVLDADGNIKEEVPHFSEVFPEDWEVPVFNDEKGNDMECIAEGPLNIAQREVDTYIHTWFEDPVTLRNPPATSNSPSFTTVPTTFYTAAGAPVVVDKIYTYGIYMNTTVEATYNVGYTNKSNGASLGRKTRLENGESFSITVPEGIDVAVRASTYDSVGEWNMRVDIRCNEY